MLERIAGFDWHDGNLAKCQKHGVTVAEIEAIFERGRIAVERDDIHSRSEERLRAIGQNNAGRFVFMVFTLRQRGEHIFIRVISARFMHKKEIRHYVEKDSGL